MKDKWPAAYEFLKEFTITNEIQNKLVKDVDVEGKDINDVVDNWVAGNEAVWSPWIDAAVN